MVIVIMASWLLQGRCGARVAFRIIFELVVSVEKISLSSSERPVYRLHPDLFRLEP